jgi:acetyl-CoA carboxylase carboxyl transferase subunit alpha
MSITHPLDFERELVDLEKQLEELKDEIAGGNLSRRDDYAKLEARVVKLRAEVYGKLTAYQRVLLSRHRDRPFTLDFVRYMFRDFIEFSGDRLFRDDPAIVGGTAKLGELSVMVVGHQRGRSTSELQKRNFGMPQPEGYRKALRLFRLAEKFKIPVITFIDTMGAYPGLEAEERGQAEAIARNLAELSELTVPVICIVIGEGGSGGALALGVGDRLLMLENACYSVITPEGCASILWPGEPVAEKAPVAAEMLQLTSRSLKSFGIIDEVVPEPTGGAHSNHKETAENLRASIVRHLEELSGLHVDELLKKRYEKFRKIGVYSGE